MALLATGISRTERDVNYYAERLNVSPKYLSATIVGATVWSITFETGVLMAYRAAASIAKMIAMRFLSLDILLIGIYPSDNPAWIANSY